MITNIHDDIGRQPYAATTGFFVETPTVFQGGDLSDAATEAVFARLGRDLSPGRFWMRQGGELRGVAGEGTLVIPAGTLCQIGRHLAPAAGGGVFCQVVSGPHRGLRFAFDALDFRDERGGLSGSRKPVRPARAA